MKKCWLLLLLIVVGCGEGQKETVPKAAEVDVAQHSSNAVYVDAEAGKTWNIFGLKIVGKIMSEETAGQYAVVMSTTPPAGGPPLHVHEKEDELFYVVKGTYEFRCGDALKTVSEGALVHLPRGKPHSFKNVGDTPGVLLNTISPGGFEVFFEDIDQLPKDQPLDRTKVAEIAAKYGLKFL